MIVYLHGTDGCGADPARLLEIESLPQYLESGRIALKNAALLAPQCPAGSNWAEQAARVMELVKAITAAEGIDPARIALTGASLGGMGTFSLGIAYPSAFSCLVPVCGAVDPERCAALTGQPAWGSAFLKRTASSTRRVGTAAFSCCPVKGMKSAGCMPRRSSGCSIGCWRKQGHDPPSGMRVFFLKAKARPAARPNRPVFCCGFEFEPIIFPRPAPPSSCAVPWKGSSCACGCSWA